METSSIVGHDVSAISFGGSPFAFDPIGMTRADLQTHASALAKQLQAMPARTHDDAVDAVDVGSYIDERDAAAAAERCLKCGRPYDEHVIKPMRSSGRPVRICPDTRGDPDVVAATVKKITDELEARRHREVIAALTAKAAEQEAADAVARERQIMARMQLIAMVRAPIDERPGTNRPKRVCT